MIYIIHTDGGSRSNPGEAAIGVTIEKKDTDSSQKIMHVISKRIGVQSNNVAEYRAIIEALTYVRESVIPKHTDSIQLFSDSLLVVQQLNRMYKVKHVDMKRLYEEIRNIENTISAPITYTHIYRDQNQDADALVNAALDS